MSSEDVYIESANDRLFRAWASVEIRDKQGEILPIDELKKTMYKLMKRGGPITISHTNQIVGKLLSYEFKMNPKYNREGVSVLGHIYSDTLADEEAWSKIQSGEFAQVSLGGIYKVQNGVAQWIAPMELSIAPRGSNYGADIFVKSMAKADLTTGGEKEKSEHPQLTNAQANRIDEQHKETETLKKGEKTGDTMESKPDKIEGKPEAMAKAAEPPTKEAPPKEAPPAEKAPAPAEQQPPKPPEPPKAQEAEKAAPPAPAESPEAEKAEHKMLSEMHAILVELRAMLSGKSALDQSLSKPAEPVAKTDEPKKEEPKPEEAKKEAPKDEAPKEEDKKDEMKKGEAKAMAKADTSAVTDVAKSSAPASTPRPEATVAFDPAKQGTPQNQETEAEQVAKGKKQVDPVKIANDILGKRN